MNYLVELEDVEELEELPVLLSVLQLDVVLLQAVEGQLGLVVDVDFHRLKRETLTVSWFEDGNWQESWGGIAVYGEGI